MSSVLFTVCLMIAVYYIRWIVLFLPEHKFIPFVGYPQTSVYQIRRQQITTNKIRTILTMTELRTYKNQLLALVTKPTQFSRQLRCN